MIKSSRSGGPRTAAGKMASSANALKTGVYAKMVVLANESEKDFEELHTQLQSDYSPQGAIETNLVNLLAIHIWKIMRLERVEHQAMMRLINRPLTDNEIMHGRFKVGILYAWLLNDLARVTPEFNDESNKFLLRYLKLDPVNCGNIDFKYVASALPTLYDLALRVAAHVLSYPKEAVTTDMIDSLEIPDPDKGPRRIALKEYLIEHLKIKAMQVLRVYDCLDDCSSKLADIKQRRLFDFLSQNHLGRAHSDIKREFYKILNELRRQQQWRIEHKTIEVVPLAMPNKQLLN